MSEPYNEQVASCYLCKTVWVLGPGEPGAPCKKACPDCGNHLVPDSDRTRLN